MENNPHDHDHHHPDDCCQKSCDSENNLNTPENSKTTETQIIKQIEALRQKLDLSEKQAKESQDKALYALAELENIKRRAQIDVEHAHKFGLEKCMNQLIPVIDSLDQAITAINASELSPAITPIKQGIEMTLNIFISTLGKFGVERLDPQGQAFDPSVHEAMSAQPSDGIPANTVTLVYQRGYKLNGRLIRPARVIIAT